MGKIFISHDSEEKDVAKHLSAFIERNFSDINVFCSSRPKDLGAGKNWYNLIISAAMGSDLCFVMLTPDNVANPWLHFESGLLRGLKEDSIVPILFGGLTYSEIPATIKFHQAMDLNDSESFNAFVQQRLNNGKKLHKNQTHSSFADSQPYNVRRIIKYGYFAQFPIEDAIPTVWKPFLLSTKDAGYTINRDGGHSKELIAIRATLIPRAINHFNHYKFGFALFDKGEKIFHFHGGCHLGINAWTLYPKPNTKVPINIPAQLEMEKPFSMSIWFSSKGKKVMCSGTDSKGARYTMQDDHGNSKWQLIRNNWDTVQVTAWADGAPFQIDVESFEVDFTPPEE
jgi:hypothetical protein